MVSNSLLVYFYFMASLVIIELVLSDLKMAHEQQKKSLEEEFEKLRLSLQVEKLLLLLFQVPSLPFLSDNQSDNTSAFAHCL